MKRLLRRIASIAKRHPQHYLGRAWHWAVKPGNAAKRRRFKALLSWSHDHYRLAKRHKQHGRAHRFWKAHRTYRRKMRHLKKHSQHHDSGGGAGTTVIDGRSVPNWMVPWVQKIRAAGRWHGIIVSGYRTPEYSESLCRSMCGAPQCSGTCAGRASNHACPPSATCQPYEGAIDVSDFYTFAAEAARLGAPFHNSLPSDRVHFSHSGV